MTEKHMILEPCANIQSAAGLRNQILAAFSGYEKITLDISQLQDVDLSFFQLAYSAQAYASRTGKFIAFSGDADEKLRAVLHRAGLADLLPTQSLNIWLHEGTEQ